MQLCTLETIIKTQKKYTNNLMTWPGPKKYFFEIDVLFGVTVYQ
jgi:hypothetical protein